jgi:hypothetical protein
MVPPGEEALALSSAGLTLSYDILAENTRRIPL